MAEHNKLVRGKIPDICRANGATPYTHVLEDDEEYLQALFAKDEEEGKELRDTPNLEELGDKLEVLYAIAAFLGYTPEQVEAARVQKRALRGDFSDRIFLERTDDPKPTQS